MKNKQNKGFITVVVWSLLLIASVIYSLFSYLDWSASITYTLVVNVRLPRVLLALLAGMGLTLAGQMFQIILNNTLADSFTLGLASGATVGAAIATFLGLSFVWIAPFAMVVGFSTLVIVIMMTKLIANGGFKRSLILSGIMIGSLFNAIIFLMVQMNPKRLQSVMNYMFGGFSSAEYREVVYIAIAFVIIVICLFLQVSQIKLLQVDAYSSRALGIDVQRLSVMVLILATILSTIIIGFTGVIGFIGIVIPQFVQRITERTLSYKMILNIIIGGTIMVLADTVGAQLLAPIQLPASIILALIGIPMMFYLMIVERGRRID
ncbi:iron ABC transporter permease [Staphylococcus felis]|uniref:FecCD family ABC transporter permease n=1 Tax=Staphylococcus felis TaxID=46127 RepID=UPI000E26CC15|nr:iron ABC transporter permease [Staphylococcus felis]REI10819.1 iron ABC transporter permease [Staphylococcus felis]